MHGLRYDKNIIRGSYAVFLDLERGLTGTWRFFCSELVKAPGKVGFLPKRQHGSYLIFRCDDTWSQAVITDHRALDRGALRAILRQKEVSVSNGMWD